MQKIIEREIFYLSPSNTLCVYNIIQEEDTGMYRVCSDLEFRIGGEKIKTADLEEARRFIEVEKAVKENNGHKIISKPEEMNIDKFVTVLKFFYDLDRTTDNVYCIETDNYKYFYYDVIEELEETKNLVERNYFFIYDTYDQYIGKFLISKTENLNYNEDGYLYHLGTIYINEDFQRKGYFSYIVYNDLATILNVMEPNEEIDGFYIHSLIKTSIPFYDKLEEEGVFDYFRAQKHYGGYLTVR